MKKMICILAVFAALTAGNANAQNNRDQVVNRTYEREIYTDDRGEYRWQVVERRVWVPEHRTRGIFGIGAQTIPGHYEMRTDRVKVYIGGRNDYGKSPKGGKNKHPHGMPPGQRKKIQRNNGYY